MSFTVWLVLAGLILATALYVAAEFAAVGVRRSRIRRLSDEGNRLAKRLLVIVDNPAALDKYVAVSQVGITITSLVLGAFAQATVAVALEPYAATYIGLDAATAASTAAIVVLVLLTCAQVLFGELIPKSLALQFPSQVALATLLPMQWSLAVWRPFIWLLNGSAVGLLKVLGIGVSGHRHIHSPEEIEMLIAESRDGGLLEPHEQRRLRGALRLRLRSARDLMVPLEKLTMLPVDTSWGDTVRLVAGSPYSRLPVYRDVPDRIIGTLRVKDLVVRYVAEGPPPSIEHLLRPVARVPHDVPADQVITILRERRMHQAVVTDADDRVIGLITIQDVLAQFLGSGMEAAS